MDTSSLVSLTGLVVGFAAAMFFAAGNARLTNKTIYMLAGTYWDYNPPIADALAVQRADYVCGAVLLAISFVLQIIGLSSLSSVISAPAVMTKAPLVSAFAITTVLTCIALLARRKMISSTKRFVEQQFKADLEASKPKAETGA